jgi:hypothetical protein
MPNQTHVQINHKGLPWAKEMHWNAKSESDAFLRDQAKLIE